MLINNEKMVIVYLNNNTQFLCSLNEAFLFAASGIKIDIIDNNTGEVLFSNISRSCIDGDAQNYISEYMSNHLEANPIYQAAKTLELNAKDSHTYKLYEELVDQIRDNYSEYGVIEVPVFSGKTCHEQKLQTLHDLEVHCPQQDNEWDPRNLIKYRSVTTMGWSIRTENCLKRVNILFLGQLLQMTAEDIIRIRNLGSRSLREIKDTLHSMGLALKDEDLSFNAKVQICAVRTKDGQVCARCCDCPLRTSSVDCFYNESYTNKEAVDKLTSDCDNMEDIHE